MFALFSFVGLWCLLAGAKWKAMLLFSLSSFVRSNGVLNAGFLLFQALHEAFDNLFCRRKSLMIGHVILLAVLQILGSALPFLLFQGYGYYQLCWRDNEDDLIARPWCSSKIPYLYGFVQKHYWNVGFLNYFQWKQLPNFLLASPMLFLATSAVISYAKNQPLLFFSLGLSRKSGSWRQVALFPTVDQDRLMLDYPKAEASSVEDPDLVSTQYLVHRQSKQRSRQIINMDHFNVLNPSMQKSGEDQISSSGGFYSPSALSFLLKLGFMTAVASFIMHVQVATRFLSSSLPIYWYAASKIESSFQRERIKTIIWTVFLCYILVGTLLQELS